METVAPRTGHEQFPGEVSQTEPVRFAGTEQSLSAPSTRPSQSLSTPSVQFDSTPKEPEVFCTHSHEPVLFRRQISPGDGQSKGAPLQDKGGPHVDWLKMPCDEEAAQAALWVAPPQAPWKHVWFSKSVP